MVEIGLLLEKLLLVGEYVFGLEKCYLELWIGFECLFGIVFLKISIIGYFRKVGVVMIDWMGIILDELKVEIDYIVFLEEGKWYVYYIELIGLMEENSRIRIGGIYFIIGGLGGFGYLFVCYFVWNYQVNVIFMGWLLINEEKKEKMKELENFGVGVFYVEVDVCDLIGMGDCIKCVKE